MASETRSRRRVAVYWTLTAILVLLGLCVGSAARGYLGKPAEESETAQTEGQDRDPASSVPAPAESMERGVAILSSEVGNDYAVDPLADLVEAAGFSHVVVDWAWITYHWDRTDLAEVRRFVQLLQAKGIKVAAMYRPRSIAKPEFPYQVDDNDNSAFEDRYHICYQTETARNWGRSWGTRIIEAVPEFDEIIIYNPLNTCRCDACLRASRANPNARVEAVWAFLSECRSEWRGLEPDVTLGVVYVADPSFWECGLDVLDTAYPFLPIQGEAPDLENYFRKLAACADVLGPRMGPALVKLAWGGEQGVSLDVLARFDRLARDYRRSHCFWTFDELFAASKPAPAEVAAALGMDSERLSPLLKALGGTQSAANTAPRAPASMNSAGDWVYFESRESTEGSPPRLVLTIRGRERVLHVEEDTLLISYLADKAWGGHRQLSISMGDTNRVLLSFDTLSLPRNAAIDKATLLLDMKLSAIPPKEHFELAAHGVTALWNERSTTWNNQPSFAETPVAVTTVAPVPGVVSVDVTPLWNAWADGRLPRHGILLKTRSVAGGAAAPWASYSADPPDLGLPPATMEARLLPWPHQPPDATPSAIAQLEHDVWVINNLPLYQAVEDGSWSYLHGGLDIVLDNGTRIYAMEPGWVKALHSGSLFIADEEGNAPCFGWEYTHLGNFQVAVGDRVERGTYVGDIEFDGLAHIHLTRIYSQDPHWGGWHYMVMPDAHFTYEDNDPPVIQSPFYFFKNNSDDMIRSQQAGATVIRGKVDIVAAMRDPGNFAHSKENGVGDRLGVAKIDFEIKPVTGSSLPRKVNSFDFTRLAVKNGVFAQKHNTDLARVVYKHWTLFETGERSGNKMLCYYVITNTPWDTPPRELAAEHSDCSWDTTATDRDGSPLYPNGAYDIEVVAEDFKGNKATATTRVIVHNGGRSS